MLSPKSHGGRNPRRDLAVGRKDEVQCARQVRRKIQEGAYRYGAGGTAPRVEKAVDADGHPDNSRVKIENTLKRKRTDTSRDHFDTTGHYGSRR